MKITHALTAAAAAGLAVVAVAGPALATGLPHDVSVSGSTATGDHVITATSSGTSFGAGTLIVNCSSADVPAPAVGPPAVPASTVHSGTGLTDIATISKINFNSCSGPGGLLTVTTSGAWAMHGTTAGTPAATDVISGHIDNITATVSNVACKFTVTGSADGTFDEATQTITINEVRASNHLKVVGPLTGCLGKIHIGDSADFSGSFAVSSVDGPINVLS